MDELWFCGEVIAPDGLGVLEPLPGPVSWPVEVRRSGYDGSDVLRARHGPVELDMDAGQANGKLFSGTVQADQETAMRLLGELSETFRNARLRHRIELYDEADGTLLGYLHHEWPQPR